MSEQGILAHQHAGSEEVRRHLLPPGPRAPAPLRLLGGLIDWATVIAGATIIILVFANVVLHQFNVDIAWTTEFSEVLMVWVTFLGGAAAGRRGEHVALVDLINVLPGRWRHWAEGVAQVVSASVLGLLVWYGIIIAEAGWTSRLSVLDWPMTVEYLAVPVSSAATLVFVLFDLLLIAIGRSREERYAS